MEVSETDGVTSCSSYQIIEQLRKMSGITLVLAQREHTLVVHGLTCNFEALYIGIVKFMFTGPASFVRFPVFQKDACHKNVV